AGGRERGHRGRDDRRRGHGKDLSATGRLRPADPAQPRLSAHSGRRRRGAGPGGRGSAEDLTQTLPAELVYRPPVRPAARDADLPEPDERERAPILVQDRGPFARLPANRQRDPSVGPTIGRRRPQLVCCSETGTPLIVACCTGG